LIEMSVRGRSWERLHNAMGGVGSREVSACRTGRDVARALGERLATFGKRPRTGPAI
jgi:hypothetical protein